jgi:biotin carboxyl carrier protein
MRDSAALRTPHSALRLRMRYFVSIADRSFEVDLSTGTPTVDGVPVSAEMSTVPGTALRHLLADGRSHTLLALPGEQRGRWQMMIGAERLSVEVVDERTQAIREMTGATEAVVERAVKAPMPGLVLRIDVEPGQMVRAGQGLVVVEAMKMENELKAPADGVVARIDVIPGQTVEKGATLIVLE